MPQFRYNANQKGMSKNKRNAALQKAKKDQPGRYAGHQYRWVSTQTMPMTIKKERAIAVKREVQQKRKPKAG